MEGPNPVSVNKDDSGPLPEFITITMSTLGDTEEACIIRKTILELRLMVWETLAQQLVFTLFGAPKQTWIVYGQGLKIILTIQCFI